GRSLTTETIPSVEKRQPIGRGWIVTFTLFERVPQSLLALRGYFVSPAPGVESSEPCRTKSTDRRVVALPRDQRRGTTDRSAPLMPGWCETPLEIRPGR